MIDLYLRQREQLKLVILLVDFRHEPSKDDIAMYEFLTSYNIPCIVVGTKADKITKNQRRKHEKVILKAMNLEEDMFLPFSSVTKENIEEIYTNEKQYYELIEL